MKRIILLFSLFLAVSLSCLAQPSQRQKSIHLAAVRIAEQIAVPNADRDAFISLYQNYKKESADIMKIAPAASNDPEGAAEAKILSDFEKSEKLLALRKAYYAKFREILSPTQIQSMYDAERASAGSKDSFSRRASR